MADHKPSFFERWFMSTNHKDIGTLYIIFAIFAGLIGGFFSMVMRMELQDPGVQFMLDDAGNPDFEEFDDFGIQSSRWQMQLGLRYIFN